MKNVQASLAAPELSNTTYLQVISWIFGPGFIPQPCFTIWLVSTYKLRFYAVPSVWCYEPGLSFNS